LISSSAKLTNMKLFGNVGVLKLYPIIWIVLVAGAFGLGGCGWLRPGPPQSDVVPQGGAVVLVGYRTTFNVRATPDQMAEAFRTEAGLKRVGLFQSVKVENNAADISTPGARIRVKAKVGRVRVPLTLTTIKSVIEPGNYQLWLASVEPVVAIQRWRIVPRGDESEVTFEVASEGLQSFAGRAISPWEAGQMILPVFDRMLAQLQAYFDPGFDIEAALSKGLRGEPVSLLYQGHTIERRIEAPPARVFDYLRRHNSFVELIGEGASRDECGGDLDTVYCQLHSRLGGQELVINRFVPGYIVNQQITYILVWSDYLALVQLKIKPEDRGRAAVVKASFAIELPGTAAATAVDLLYGLTKVPDRLVQAMSQMKQDLETETRSRAGLGGERGKE